MKHVDYVKRAEKLSRALAKVSPPYSHIKVRGWDGGLELDEYGDVAWTPKEAVRVAKWILEYYGENPEEVYLG